MSAKIATPPAPDTIAALLNEAGVLCESAKVYRAAGLHVMADGKRRDALALIGKAQRMMTTTQEGN